MSRAEALAQLRRYAEAVPAWDLALANDTGVMRPFNQMKRALTVAHLGDHARATKEAADLAAAAAGGHIEAGMLAEAACVHAVASAAAARDARLPEAERGRLADRYAARAVELLRRARAAGYFDTPQRLQETRKATDFAPLRSRKDFQDLLAELSRAGTGGK
jgi:hypothetical protein